MPDVNGSSDVDHAGREPQLYTGEVSSRPLLRCAGPPVTARARSNATCATCGWSDGWGLSSAPGCSWRSSPSWCPPAAASPSPRCESGAPRPGRCTPAPWTSSTSPLPTERRNSAPRASCRRTPRRRSRPPSRTPTTGSETARCLRTPARTVEDGLRLQFEADDLDATFDPHARATPAAAGATGRRPGRAARRGARNGVHCPALGLIALAAPQRRRTAAQLVAEWGAAGSAESEPGTEVVAPIALDVPSLRHDGTLLLGGLRLVPPDPGMAAAEVLGGLATTAASLAGGLPEAVAGRARQGVRAGACGLRC